MNKKICIAANCLLFVWFFFDMFGLSAGSFVLVESAWRDIDGIWFLIYIGLFVLFCFKDKYRYPLLIFLFLWIAVQFSSHWYFTLFGSTETKLEGYNRFYAYTYHIIPASDSKIIPDFYHIVLHFFILISFSCMTLYCIKSRKKNS